jgi:Skp family chaperone for outer membrane proteins
MTDETCCGACGYPVHATKESACDWCRQSADRIEALEAKLTKAVGLLGKSLVKEKRDLSSTLYEEISDFIEEIAEIKGESHD